MHHRDDADEGHAHAPCNQANNANNRCTVRDSSAFKSSRSGSWIIVPRWSIETNDCSSPWDDPTSTQHVATVFGRASLIAFRPLLSATGQDSPVDTEGEGRTIAKGQQQRSQRNCIRCSIGEDREAESNYSFVRTVRNRLQTSSSCLLSLSPSLGIFTIAIRHVTFLCVFLSFFFFYAKRFSTLYWRQLKKSQRYSRRVASMR